MLTQLYVWMSSYIATLKQEEGQGMAEYGLLLALIAVLLIAALGFLRGGIESAFSSVTSGLGGASGGSGL